MNVIEQMKQYKNVLTPRELEIYEIVMGNPLSVVTSTASQIAAKYGISQSAFSRFCQKVGFNSFSDLRTALALAIGAGQSRAEDASVGEGAGPSDASYYLNHMVQVTRDMLPDELLERLAIRLRNSHMVYTAGTSLSSFPAQLLAFQLILNDIPAHYVPSGQEVEILHVTQNSDTVLLFSATNPTHQSFCINLHSTPEKKKPYTILVASSQKHPLRNMVDEVIQLPNWVELQYPNVTDFSFPPTVFCYLLSHILLRTDASK